MESKVQTHNPERLEEYMRRSDYGEDFKALVLKVDYCLEYARRPDQSARARGRPEVQAVGAGAGKAQGATSGQRELDFGRESQNWRGKLGGLGGLGG